VSDHDRAVVEGVFELTESRIGAARCQMHRFLAAVLLWTPRLDAFYANPEAQPPDREMGETEKGAVAGKGGDFRHRLPFVARLLPIFGKVGSTIFCRLSQRELDWTRQNTAPLSVTATGMRAGHRGCTVPLRGIVRRGR
jgi:hypothetical protein